VAPDRYPWSVANPDSKRRERRAPHPNGIVPDARTLVLCLDTSFTDSREFKEEEPIRDDSRNSCHSFLSRLGRLESAAFARSPNSSTRARNAAMPTASAQAFNG